MPRPQVHRQPSAPMGADFAAWCDPLGLEPLPATPETVSAYLATLADTGLKASTIRRRKAAIAFTHLWCGFEPPTNADVVKKTLAGINRGLGTAPKQKSQRLRPTSWSASSRASRPAPRLT